MLPTVAGRPVHERDDAVDIDAALKSSDGDWKLVTLLFRREGRRVDALENGPGSPGAATVAAVPAHQELVEVAFRLCRKLVLLRYSRTVACCVPSIRASLVLSGA